MSKNQRELPPYLKVIKGGADSGTPISKRETVHSGSVRTEEIEDELIGYIQELVAMLRPYIPENSDFPRDEKSMRTRIGILLWNLRLTMRQEFPDGIPLTQASVERLSNAFSRMEVKYPDPIDEYLLPPLIETVSARITKRFKRK